jgi:hypothetical protein
MNCLFFLMRHGGRQRWRYPVGRVVSLSPQPITRRCPVCHGDVPIRYTGEATLCAEDHFSRPPATEWPDCMQDLASIPGLLLSQRVVEVLRAECTGILDFQPARVIQNTCAKLRTEPPLYFYMNIAGRIDIDPVASEVTGPEPCSGCYVRDGYFEARRLVPVRESWDGSDLFKIRNLGTGQIYCSRRVVELARRERWTNLNIQPMDTETRFSYRFEGIDYLGEKWPPDNWYPEPPQTGRTPEQWVETLKSAEGEENYRAQLALLEVGGQVLPQLLDLLAHGNDVERVRAAQVLSGLRYSGTELPSEVVPAIERELR